MNLKSERTWNRIGVILGVLILLVGIIFMANPAQSYSASTPDDVSFGGDFYTYQYEATRIAARNVSVAANNIRELGAMLAIYYGSALVLVGLLMIFTYGRKLALEIEPVPVCEVVPVQEPAEIVETSPEETE